MYDVPAFWDRLKAVLKNNNLTMKQLSQNLGYSEKSYDVKKSTGVLPTTSDIIQLCQMFDISADWLLFGKSENAFDGLSQKQKDFILKTIENLRDYEQN